MDQYGDASASARGKANRPIVQRLLRRPANQQVSINKIRRTVSQFPLWTVLDSRYKCPIARNLMTALVAGPIRTEFTITVYSELIHCGSVSS